MIPVVMAGALDPVTEGLIWSLGQPSGNFTGFSLQSAEAVAKRLELLREVVTPATEVAVLWERTVVSHWQVADTALVSVCGSYHPSRFETRAKSKQLSGRQRTREQVVSWCWPAEFSTRNHGASQNWRSRADFPPSIRCGRRWRPAGSCVLRRQHRGHLAPCSGVVDKILKGANPAFLPVEQPSKFELVINLKAARSIDLAIL